MHRGKKDQQAEGFGGGETDRETQTDRRTERHRQTDGQTDREGEHK